MKSAKFQIFGFNKNLNKYRYKILSKHLKGKTCLELGAGYGHITEQLRKRFSKLVTIEPDPECFNNIIEGVEKYCTTIEDFEDSRKFDTVICSNVLEHVDNVLEVLRKISTFGHDKTVYIFVVPNAISYNRLSGVDMGLLSLPNELTEQDVAAGHKRMFYPKMFREEIEVSGYEIELLETYLYKPFHNTYMSRLPSKVISHCFAMKMKDNGAEIIAVCKK